MSGPSSSWRDALGRSRRIVRRRLARGRDAVHARPRLTLALGALLSVGTALRLYGLGAESLWIDEAITVALIRRAGPLELLTVVPRQQPHLPTYYVLLDLWRSVTGPSDAALRAFSAVCSVLTLPFVYGIGTWLFSRRAGLLALAVAALSRFQLAYGQEIRMYALLMLLTTASFYCLLRRAERRWAAAYVGTAIAAAYVHPFGGLGVVGGLAYLAVARRSGTPAWPGTAGDRRAPAAVALALVPLVAAAAVEFASGFDLTFVPTPGPRFVALALQGFLGTWPNAWFGVAAAIAFAAAGVVAIAVGARRWPDRAAGGTLLVVAWLTTPVLVLVAVSHLLTPVFWPRYVAGAAPAAYLLIGRGLALVWPTGPSSSGAALGARLSGNRRAGRLLRVALVALLLSTLLPSAMAYHTTDQHEEWETAVADIEDRASPDALVVVDNCMTLTAYREYAERPALDVAGVVGPESGMAVRRTPDDRVREIVRDRREVWLVLSHAVTRERERMRRLLDVRHDPTWNRSYVGIEVVRYERPAAVNRSPADPSAPEMDCQERLL